MLRRAARKRAGALRKNRVRRGRIHDNRSRGTPGPFHHPERMRRMRVTLLALALAASALPAAARADLVLRLERFDGPARPAQHLDVPALSVQGLPSLALDEGGGAAARQ